MSDLRDAAASVGKPVKEVAPQTGQVGRRHHVAAAHETNGLDPTWPPAAKGLVDDEQVDKILEGLSLVASLECATWPSPIGGSR